MPVSPSSPTPRSPATPLTAPQKALRKLEDRLSKDGATLSDAERRDLDVGARAFASVSRRWRLEARGRYRDLTATDGYQLRDVTGAIGFGVEASPPGPRSLPQDDRWRVMTLFVGVAARRASELTPGALSATARAAPPSAAPWQVLLWLDLDTTIDSDRRVW